MFKKSSYFRVSPVFLFLPKRFSYSNLSVDDCHSKKRVLFSLLKGTRGRNRGLIALMGTLLVDTVGEGKGQKKLLLLVFDFLQVSHR